MSERDCSSHPSKQARQRVRSGAEKRSGKVDFLSFPAKPPSISTTNGAGRDLERWSGSRGDGVNGLLLLSLTCRCVVVKLETTWRSLEQTLMQLFTFEMSAFTAAVSDRREFTQLHEQAEGRVDVCAGW